MTESRKGVSPAGELERGGVVEVPVEEESVDVTAELAELRQAIEELRPTPDFAEEVQFLEGEVRELEAFRTFVLSPGQALDEDLAVMETTIAEIRGALEEVAAREAGGVTASPQIHIPPAIKRRLIRIGRLLLRIERWLLWLCRLIPWSPWRRRCRRLARLITRIGLLLIWIARRFCEE